MGVHAPERGWNRSDSRRRVVCTVAAALAVALAVGAAPAALAEFKPEYKLSVVVGPDTAWGKGAQRFADLVRERTQGRVNIKVYYSGQLFAGQQTNEFLLVRQGVGDFALASTINWSPQVRELNLFSLPFFFADFRELDAVQNGQAGREVFALLRRLGVEPLGWGENGFRQLTNRVRPVRRPQDLAGLKIRVVGSKIFIDTFQALGANPTTMNWSEAITAFQQGVVDGQENPVVGVIIPYKLHDFHRYLTAWNYTIDPLILAVNAGVWRSFPEDVRAAVQQSAADALRYQKALARVGLDDGSSARYLASLGESVAIDDPYGYLRSRGMEVILLSDADRQAFRERVRSVVESWEGQIGSDLVRKAEADKAAVR